MFFIDFFMSNLYSDFLYSQAVDDIHECGTGLRFKKELTIKLIGLLITANHCFNIKAAKYDYRNQNGCYKKSMVLYKFYSPKSIQ